MQIINLNIQIPSSWEELTDSQLRYLYSLIADEYTTDSVKVYCFFRWSGMKVLYHEDKSSVIVEYNNDIYKLQTEQIVDMVAMMKWMDELPAFPRQLESIGGKAPCAVDFQQVPFERFLYCDNLYQGYLFTKNLDLLNEMIKVLYDYDEAKGNNAELISVFYWFASLKQFFAKKFSHFFQPVASGDNLLGVDIASRVQESMDLQIRALTKGDITKEDVIKKADTWRALTELDAQAKEYEELKRIYNK